MVGCGWEAVSMGWRARTLARAQYRSGEAEEINRTMRELHVSGPPVGVRSRYIYTLAMIVTCGDHQK